MANTGKYLEDLVSLIHDSLANVPVQIFKNKKILNSLNMLREFDVVIVSDVNGIKITIAIECKDYKSPVGVEKIEAFYSKCQNIPEINKLIFVARNGFQDGAKKVAKGFGIDLYRVDELNVDVLNAWISKFQQLHLKVKANDLALYLGSEEDYLLLIQQEFDGIIYSQKNEQPINCLYYLNTLINEKRKTFLSATILNLLKNDMIAGFENKINVPFKIHLSDYYILTKSRGNVVVNSIEGNLDFWFETSLLTINDAKSYAENGSSDKAHYLSTMMSNNQKTEIVQTERGTSFYLIGNEDDRAKLGLLATFDSKTGKLIRNSDITE